MRNRWLSSARILAVLGAAVFLAVVAYSGLKRGYYWQTEVRVFFYAVLPALGAMLCLATLRMAEGRAMAILVNGGAGFVALGAVEVILQAGWIDPRKPPPPPVAEEQPVPAYGTVCGHLFTRAEGKLPLPVVAGGPLVPVGGLAGAPVRWVEWGGGQGVYRLDQYGFTNPPGSWEPPTDAVAVGDSYAVGLEVAPGRGFVDLARPFLGRTVNLGCAGNGPLLELGSLLEYGPSLAPPLVLWFYYEGNDLTVNLPAELANPVLARYLDGTTQDLMRRNAAKDEAWRQVLPPPGSAGTGMRAAEPAGRIDWKAAASLAGLRSALGMQLDFDPAILSIFRSILRDADAAVRGWGGRMVFVYLPSEPRHTTWMAGLDADAYKRKVLAEVDGLGLPVVDVAEVFSRQPEPRLLYHGNHYTRDGYALVAEVLREKLAYPAAGR